MKMRGCNSPKHRLRNSVDKALVLLKCSLVWPRPALGTKMDFQAFQATVDNECASEHQKNERVHDR